MVRKEGESLNALSAKDSRTPFARSVNQYEYLRGTSELQVGRWVEVRGCCPVGLQMCTHSTVFAQSIPSPNPPSPFYVAPEVIKGEEHGQASDIFSFGLVLLECAASYLAKGYLLRDFRERGEGKGDDYVGRHVNIIC